MNVSSIIAILLLIFFVTAFQAQTIENKNDSSLTTKINESSEEDSTETEPTLGETEPTFTQNLNTKHTKTKSTKHSTTKPSTLSTFTQKIHHHKSTTTAFSVEKQSTTKTNLPSTNTISTTSASIGISKKNITYDSLNEWKDDFSERVDLLYAYITDKSKNDWYIIALIKFNNFFLIFNIITLKIFRCANAALSATKQLKSKFCKKCHSSSQRKLHKAEKMYQEIASSVASNIYISNTCSFHGRPFTCGEIST